MQTLVERFQCALATDRVSEKHGQKVDHLILAETTASNVYLLSDGRKDILLPKVLYHQDTFPKPGWCGGHRLRGGLDDD